MNFKQLTSKDKDTLRDLARGDLYFFAKGILGYDWLVPHIHMPLARLLELYDGYNDTLRASREDYKEILVDTLKRMSAKLVLEDREGFTEDQIEEKSEKYLNEGIKRLLVVIPRGWLKTTLCSISYPIWRAIRDKEIRSLLAQNTHTNACSKLSSIDGIFSSNDLFKTLFSDLLPDRNTRWTKESKTVKRDKTFPEGTFEAAGTKTQVTSRHYGLIIEDDTVAPDKDDLGEENVAPTKEDVDQAIGWHKLVVPLLNNPTKDQNLVVGTRWFQKDLISWIHDTDDTFLLYERACREDDQGLADEKGRITYPERFNEEVLRGLWNSLGPYLASCLYLNRPITSGDQQFLPEWIKYYNIPPRNCDLAIFTTVDPAGDPEESKGDPDYNVVLTAGKNMSTGDGYVLKYDRVKCSPGELVNIIFRHVAEFSPIKVGLETVQYQKSIKYWLQERMRKQNSFFVIESLTHSKRSKNARILGLQPLFANGVIFVKPHMKDLVTELLSFPRGANDDIIDALASQLELWKNVSVKKSKIVRKGEDILRSIMIDILREKNSRTSLLDDVMCKDLPDYKHLR